MSTPLEQASAELEAAQSALKAALKAWDESVSELWRTSLALTSGSKESDPSARTIAKCAKRQQDVATMFLTSMDQLPPVLYRRANSGYRIQGFVAEEVSDNLDGSS